VHQKTKMRREKVRETTFGKKKAAHISFLFAAVFPVVSRPLSRSAHLSRFSFLPYLSRFAHMSSCTHTSLLVINRVSTRRHVKEKDKEGRKEEPGGGSLKDPGNSRRLLRGERHQPLVGSQRLVHNPKEGIVTSLASQETTRFP